MSISLFLSLMALSCGYAFARGGSPERVAAMLQLGAFASTVVVHLMLDMGGFRSANVGTAMVDALLLAALVILAWRSTRFWPLWLAGWQVATVVAHLAKMLDPEMKAAGYAIQAQIWAYPMLIAMAIGTLRHQMRLRAGDPDPAWKPMPLWMPPVGVGNQT